MNGSVHLLSLKWETLERNNLGKGNNSSIIRTIKYEIAVGCPKENMQWAAEGNGHVIKDKF